MKNIEGTITGSYRTADLYSIIYGIIGEACGLFISSVIHYLTTEKIEAESQLYQHCRIRSLQDHHHAEIYIGS